MHETCPETSKLVELLVGEPDSELLSHLVEHLEECPACMDHLARLNENLVVEDSSPDPPLTSNTLDVGPLERLKATPSMDRHHKIGHFRIIRKLGEGGMGQVYECLDERLGRHVAVKWIKPSILSPKVLERLEREARIHARLTHPNIVSLLDFGIAEGFPYLVMELIQGGTLRAIVRESKLNPYESATLLADVARAIHAAHGMGIAHLDLKPANILLQLRSVDSFMKLGRIRQESGWTPKVTDFGLAKSVDTILDENASMMVRGTPYYMAPEQFKGRSKTIGPAADIYALGVILYELLTGRVPFSGQAYAEVSELILNRPPIAPREIQASVPLDIQTICLKCLEKEPWHRYASAEELAEDLARFTQKRPILARPIGLIGKTWRMGRRNPLAAGLIFITSLSITLLALGSMAFAYSQKEMRREADRLRQLAQTNEKIANQRLVAMRENLFRELETASNNYDDMRIILDQGTHPDRVRDFYRSITNQRFDRAMELIRRPEMRHEESESMVEAFYLAALLTQVADQDSAITLFQTAVDLAKAIAAKRPLNNLARFCALNSDNYMGVIRLQHNRLDEALIQFQDGWDNFRIRPAETPADPRLKRFSLMVGANLVKELTKGNRKSEARTVLSECAVIQRMTETEQP